MAIFEIYSTDLTKEAKARFEEHTGINLEDTNYDIMPMAVVTFDESINYDDSEVDNESK